MFDAGCWRLVVLAVSRPSVLPPPIRTRVDACRSVAKISLLSLARKVPNGFSGRLCRPSFPSRASVPNRTVQLLRSRSKRFTPTSHVGVQPLNRPISPPVLIRSPVVRLVVFVKNSTTFSLRACRRQCILFPLMEATMPIPSAPTLLAAPNAAATPIMIFSSRKTKWVGSHRRGDPAPFRRTTACERNHNLHLFCCAHLSQPFRGARRKASDKTAKTRQKPPKTATDPFES